MLGGDADGWQGHPHRKEATASSCSTSGPPSATGACSRSRNFSSRSTFCSEADFFFLSACAAVQASIVSCSHLHTPHGHAVLNTARSGHAGGSSV